MEVLNSQEKENSLKSLSDEELLSVFLPEQTANDLITEYQNIYGLIMRTSLMELANVKGIGKAKVQKINCIRELLNRIQSEKQKQIIQITAPKDIADYMQNMEHLEQEEFKIIMLNTKNKIIGQQMISRGTVNATLVAPREIFNPAIKAMATTIILVHNHPSGDPSPSQEDFNMTKRVIEVGKIVGIHVIDHVIIGKNQYYSMKESGFIDQSVQ